MSRSLQSSPASVSSPEALCRLPPVRRQCSCSGGMARGVLARPRWRVVWGSPRGGPRTPGCTRLGSAMGARLRLRSGHRCRKPVSRLVSVVSGVVLGPEPLPNRPRPRHRPFYHRAAPATWRPARSHPHRCHRLGVRVVSHWFVLGRRRLLLPRPGALLAPARPLHILHSPFVAAAVGPLRRVRPALPFPLAPSSHLLGGGGSGGLPGRPCGPCPFPYCRAAVRCAALRGGRPCDASATPAARFLQVRRHFLPHHLLRFFLFLFLLLLLLLIIILPLLPSPLFSSS